MKLANWFEISEKDYIWYILQGYDIRASETLISWYLDNQLHRTDGPAIEWADGTRKWYVNDKLHRTDGPALEGADGTREWYVNDQLHRTDGPALEGADGTRKWYLNDQLHRTDGPAIEYSDGYPRKWYLNGEQMTEYEYEFYKRITNENKRNTVD